VDESSAEVSGQTLRGPENRSCGNKLEEMRVVGLLKRSLRSGTYDP